MNPEVALISKKHVSLTFLLEMNSIGGNQVKIFDVITFVVSKYIEFSLQLLSLLPSSS